MARSVKKGEEAGCMCQGFGANRWDPRRMLVELGEGGSHAYTVDLCRTYQQSIRMQIGRKAKTMAGDHKTQSKYTYVYGRVFTHFWT